MTDRINAFVSTTRLDNPYLAEFEWLQANSDDWNHGASERDALKTKYSWAVPNEKAIRAVASLSPLVEIGAGTGYWASLISQAGADIVAYDISPYENRYCEGQYYDVQQDSWHVIAEHPDRTLFVCWPPYGDPMAELALRNYQGGQLIYVGEWDGCTASEEFFTLLNERWMKVLEIYIPTWPGDHDSLSVWERL